MKEEGLFFSCFKGLKRIQRKGTKSDRTQCLNTARDACWMWQIDELLTQTISMYIRQLHVYSSWERDPPLFLFVEFLPFFPPLKWIFFMLFLVLLYSLYSPLRQLYKIKLTSLEFTETSVSQSLGSQHYTVSTDPKLKIVMVKTTTWKIISLHSTMQNHDVYQLIIE